MGKLILIPAIISSVVNPNVHKDISAKMTLFVQPNDRNDLFELVYWYLGITH